MEGGWEEAGGGGGGGSGGRMAEPRPGAPPEPRRSGRNAGRRLDYDETGTAAASEEEGAEDAVAGHEFAGVIGADLADQETYILKKMLIHGAKYRGRVSFGEDDAERLLERGVQRARDEGFAPPV